MSAFGDEAEILCSTRALPVLTPSGHWEHSTCLSALSHRLGDGNVVSSVHCMHDPQPEGHMASYIERRKFLATLGCAAATWPLAARAQSAGRMRRIGVLMTTSADDPEGQSRIAAFHQGLQQWGWTVGGNVTVDI